MSKEKPKIGGIGQQREQYSTIGGKRPDAQTLERRDVQESELPDAEIVSSQTTQEPEYRSVQELERPDVQEPDHPETQTRKRHTIYLPPDISRWLKIHAASTDQEISEVAEKALQHYRQEIEP